MSESILTSTKKVLGLAEAYTPFDADVIMHINTVLATLSQIGIGPEGGFSITDATPTWEDLLGSDPQWNLVPTYVYLKVRQYFDPPGTGFLTNAMKEQIAELEERLSLAREAQSWVNPNTDLSAKEDDIIILDGGSI